MDALLHCAPEWPEYTGREHGAGGAVRIPTTLKPGKEIRMFSKISFLQGKAARLTGDFALSIFASLVYTFARQIVVFPILADRLSDSDYGTLLTVIGLANVCTALIGSSLNNVRLIQQSNYEKAGYQGDFLPLCGWGSIVSLVFSGLLWWYFRYSAVTALLLTAYMLVYNLYLYGSAYFRLHLDFKRNLIANAVISTVYVPAAFLFATPTLWPAVFLLAEGVGLVYTALTMRFYREPFAKTPLFHETTKKLVLLMLSNLVGNVLMYADRMILHPILGPESVSYYSTASFFGKSASVVMVPIAGVLLGYFAQKDFQASKKLFVLVNGLSLACLAVFMLGCMLFGPWFTRLLYPSLYEQSAPYLILANFGAVVGIAGNMAQPMILKCCSTRWILAIQVLYGAAYLLFSIWLLPLYGLLGFCWATILSNGVRLLALYALGLWKFH